MRPGARRLLEQFLCPYEDHPFSRTAILTGLLYLQPLERPCFAFSEAEWDRIVLELQATRPEILEGEPVYLSLLARAVMKRGVRVPTIRAVILTYGKASLQHGRRIREAFPAPQVDLYGSTEAGYLFVGEAFRDNSKVVDDNAFIELVPWRDGVEGVHQIHVTTRGREAMPLLRYHTGDIVQSMPGGYRILGRERDLSFRPDGSLVSAADVDAALSGHVRLLALMPSPRRRKTAGTSTMSRSRPPTMVRSRGPQPVPRSGGARQRLPQEVASPRGERQVRTPQAPRKGLISQARASPGGKGG